MQTLVLIAHVVRRGAMLAGVALLAGVSTAHAQTTVTLFSDSADYIGAGQQRVYTPGNGHVTATQRFGLYDVDVSGGTNGDAFTLEFAAPPGKQMHRGVYDYAQRAPFRQAGRPGIDISGDGRGCNTTTGRFEVRDIALTKSHQPKRLWLIYEQHCEGAQPAAFGEVRYNEPTAKVGPFAPTITRWPETNRGVDGPAVPITFTAPRSLYLKSASVAGGRGAFRIRLDECSNVHLSAAGKCDVWVRFLARHTGTRKAKLVVRDGQGRKYQSRLQGFSWGGVTRVVLDSDPNDYIGGGRSRRYTQANAMISGGASRQHASFVVNAGNGDYWFGDFSPASGDILASGTTYRGATRDPFRGSGPGLEVTGEGRGCNQLDGQFTVKDLRFGKFGSLRGVGVSFIQHCEHSKAALRGEFDFRAGDHTKPAPWMGRIGR